jgi:glutathione peroxidase
MPTLYDIPVKTIGGELTTLAQYRGKVLLIVNVASKCGLTPQYTALEGLYHDYRDKGLTVLGFPANDFAGQEPGTDQEIAKFCSTDYAVSFPMFSKIVVTGDTKHPLYTELISAQPSHVHHDAGFRDNLHGYGLTTHPLPEVLWNFEKFLVGKDGAIVARFAPDMPPNDPRITSAIEKALEA